MRAFDLNVHMEAGTGKRNFIIATHGNFAQGIKSSLDIIIGQVENVVLISAYVDGNKSIEEEISAALQTLHAQDELIIFTDLLGGSITNQVLRQTQGKNVHVISGFNLALLIEILLSDVETPAPALIEAAIITARGQMVYVNELIPSNKADSSND